MTDMHKDALMKLAEAQEAGVDMNSPKAVVTYLLGKGDKEVILFFYKPNSVEFDFAKYEALVQEMRNHKRSR